MAEENTPISSIVNTIRTGMYGKDIREAIANGLKKCYDHVSGASIEDAIVRAEEASDSLSELVEESASAISGANAVVDDLSNAVIVSDEQPTDTRNKIWIKPQAEDTYRIASFEAYSELWDRVNELNNTYNSGHGGIKSIILDENYVDESEQSVLPVNRRIKRYVVTFADETQDDFVITSAVGPVDTLQENGIVVEYAKGVVNDGVFDKTPPPDEEGIWSETMPTLNPGDYLWIRTKNIYVSGNTSVIYSVSQFGKDGDNGVTSIKLGDDGDVKTGDVVIPLDSVPTENNTDHLVSSSGVWSFFNELKTNPEFINSPTAPTPPDNDDSAKLATTEFVNRAVKQVRLDTTAFLDSPEFTGVPTSTIPGSTDDAGNVLFSPNMIATTAYVQQKSEETVNSFLANNFAWPNFKISCPVITRPPMPKHFRGILLVVPAETSHMVKISTEDPNVFDLFLMIQANKENELKYTIFSDQSIGSGYDISVDDENTNKLMLMFNETGYTVIPDFSNNSGTSYVYKRYNFFVTDMVLYANLEDDPDRNVFISTGRSTT